MDIEKKVEEFLALPPKELERQLKDIMDKATEEARLHREKYRPDWRTFYEPMTI